MNMFIVMHLENWQRARPCRKKVCIQKFLGGTLSIAKNLSNFVKKLQY